MIKRIQKRFVMVTMFSFLVVVIILIGAINAINLHTMNQELTQKLNMLEKNAIIEELDQGEQFNSVHDLKREKAEHEKQLRYFIVVLDAQNKIEAADTSVMGDQSDIHPQEFVDVVLEHKKIQGYYKNYKYCVSNDNDGKRIIFLYCETELMMAKETFMISIAVSVLMLIIMFLLVVGLSGRAIRPLIESSEKQKRFITDAGHEIKTPLGIISANTDVLELMEGKSEWTESIHHQVDRLDTLVKNLLVLSKMDETKKEHSFEEFNISEIIYRGAKNFCAVAETKKITYDIDIESDIQFYGERTEIEQLVSILVDNAMKYVSDGGNVLVTLKRNKYKKQIGFCVYNTVTDIETNKMNRWFERFYREDASRSRTSGGYGIGLSIAQSIVELHKGKITAKSEDKTSVLLCVTFPLKK